MGWQTLSCHNLALTTVDGDGSIFPHQQSVSKYDFATKTANCLKHEGSKPNFDYQFAEFGDNLDQLKNNSNIIFVNGEMDPWLPGCVQTQLNENMPVLTVKNGAHHLDSFLPRQDDDTSGTNVSEVRS